MYGFQQYIDITPEMVLQRVKQEEIFEFVLKEPFAFGVKYCSPCREDKKPNCRFEEREDGTILFVDFGERVFGGNTHRTCFQLLMDAERVSMNRALELIVEEFKLSNDPTNYERAAPKVYKKKEKATEVEISYEKAQFNYKDARFWNQFLITKENLEEDNVFCAASYRMKKESKGKVKITRFKAHYGHLYAMDFISRVKLYQPYANPDLKWISNCDENDIGNINNIDLTGKRLIIQKAYKDYRTTRNLLNDRNIVWFQSEGCVPDLAILQNLMDRFDEIVFMYDFDNTGILASEKIANIMGTLSPKPIKRIFIPERCQLKNVSDLVQKEGRLDSLQILKEIGL